MSTDNQKKIRVYPPLSVYKTVGLAYPELTVITNYYLLIVTEDDMRFLMDQQAYDAMRARKDHTADCYVRPGQYLHHMYVDGVKYEVARAVMECLKEAQAKNDTEAVHHLQLHKSQLDQLLAAAWAT